nr:hypothetical protein KNIQTVNV_KNIQTVNV_CDS_0006 [Microvirus sp.]
MLKINICARAIYVRAHLFCLYVRVSVYRKRQPIIKNSFRQAVIPMKNTSLCFFGQCQRKARPA